MPEPEPTFLFVDELASGWGTGGELPRVVQVAADRVVRAALHRRDCVGVVAVVREPATLATLIDRLHASVLAPVLGVCGGRLPDCVAYSAERGVLVMDVETLRKDGPRRLRAIAARARDDHDLIQAYAVRVSLGPAEADYLWQLHRGVHERLIHEAQGVDPRSVTDRMKVTREKVQLPLARWMLDEALGRLRVG